SGRRARPPRRADGGGRRRQRRWGGRRRRHTGRAAAVLHPGRPRRRRRGPGARAHPGPPGAGRRPPGAPRRPRRARPGGAPGGQRGELEGEGRLSVSGRKADTIVSGGENVSPAEVEGVLEGHPAVREAAILGRADARWGEAVTAIVVPAGEAGTLDERELREH